MRDKGFGRIIFISSESGVQIPTEMIHYDFSKSADLALMRGFGQALAATGVTVNAVLGPPKRSQFTLIGHDVNVAARLEQARRANPPHPALG
jgi:NAD(P)-dependent dehydrogenase (short-subunit alcohol dehydrogenase family)